MLQQDLSVTASERSYLRELAKRMVEVANLPIMAQRAEQWYAHNAMKAQRPMIVFEIWGLLNEILPLRKCTSPLAAAIEWQMLEALTNHEMVDDDKVITPEYRVFWQIDMREFDVKIETTHGTDDKGRHLGFSMEHPIRDLAKDLPKLKNSVYSVDQQATMARKAAIEDVIGDLLTVRLDNQTLGWHAAPSMKIVYLMGMEAMLMAMMDQPDELKALYRFITDDIKAFMFWQEREGLLTPNNGNDYAGSGSYGFSRELHPTPGGVKLSEQWLNMNSQETVGISPDMFEEFANPSYQELAKLGGLVYYGCCEPVHGIWENCISRLAHLRKVSISPWCDEAAMGERLRSAPVIYSRKPKPNFIGVGQLDEQAFADHISTTLTAARGCHLEFIFRDVYTLDGDLSKPGRAVKIVRKQIDNMWK